MPNPLSQIRPDNALLLVVDVQERLLPAIHDNAAVVEACRRMIEAAKVLEVPMVVTEQYPEGIGRTCQVLLQCLGDAPLYTKTRFSACVEPVVDKLASFARPNVVIIGIEAHVCVMQTTLDLLRLGYTPYLCADAVGSRRPYDRDTAIERLRHAGAIVTTTESVTFELMGQAGTDVFRRILKIVK
ncbi:MAG: hydrolase [Phycisphaerae bacterium]